MQILSSDDVERELNRRRHHRRPNRMRAARQPAQPQVRPRQLQALAVAFLSLVAPSVQTVRPIPLWIHARVEMVGRSEEASWRSPNLRRRSLFVPLRAGTVPTVRRAAGTQTKIFSRGGLGGLYEPLPHSTKKGQLFSPYLRILQDEVLNWFVVILQICIQ